MSSLAAKVTSSQMSRLAFFGSKMVVFFDDGRELVVPLEWYPRLAKASDQDKENYRIIGNGQAIHWPAIDEDLDVLGLLGGHPSPEFRKNKSSKIIVRS